MAATASIASIVIPPTVCEGEGGVTFPTSQFVGGLINRPRDHELRHGWPFSTKSLRNTI